MLNRPAAPDLVRRLFPERAIQETIDADLMDALSPDLGFAHVGCYPGLAIVSDAGLGRDRPSGVPRHILEVRSCRWIYLIAMISFLDCAVVAAWHEGQLRRSVSVTFNGQLADPPVSGEIVENIGDPLPFERPLWARQGQRGEQRIPFHPLELGQAALASILGLPYASGLLDPVEYGTVPSPDSAALPCPAQLPKPKNATPKRQHGDTRAPANRALPARNCP